MEGDLDLVWLPLVLLEGPRIPDHHGPGSVLAGGDLARELEVLHGVIFRAYGQPVVGRLRGDPVGDRPRGERSVVLETEVPVKPSGVVLLDGEAGAPPCLRLPVAGRFGRGLEVTLAAVGLELLVGHRAQRFGELW